MNDTYKAISYIAEGATPQELRDEFVKWCRYCETNARVLAECAIKKRDKARYLTEANVYGHTADFWEAVEIKQPQSKSVDT